MRRIQKLAAAAAVCLLLSACAPAPDAPAPAVTATTTSPSTTSPSATAASTAAATETVTVTATATMKTTAVSVIATTTAATATATVTATATLPTPTPPPTADLLAVAPWDLGFLAVGAGGTAALLDTGGALTLLPSPVTADLRAVATYGDTALIAGDRGALLTYDGETFRSVPGADADLLSVARFGDVWYIGGAGGALFTFDGGALTARPLSLLGDVVGLAADDTRLIGVTSLGEAFSLLPDGTRQIYSANADRQGADQVAFIGIAEANGLFWATALTAGGEPAVFTTLYGGIWSQRLLTVMEGAPFDPAGLRLGGVTAAGEQAVVAVSGGRLLILPDCVQCNKLLTVGVGDLLAVCRNGDKLAAVGKELAAAVTDDEQAHQYKISFETAQQYLAGGAALIDVREAADYAARHIAGSVNIPLSRLEEELPARYPDPGAALVFYCAKGVRSAAAAQTAAALGYARAYTVGGIDDGAWTYE